MNKSALPWWVKADAAFPLCWTGFAASFSARITSGFFSDPGLRNVELFNKPALEILQTKGSADYFQGWKTGSFMVRIFLLLHRAGTRLGFPDRIPTRGAPPASPSKMRMWLV